MKSMNKILPAVNRRGQVIAVTGGIGTGKSFILHCFKHLKFYTYSYDQVITTIYEKGGAGQQLLAQHFPQVLINDCVSKAKLGELVFSDREKLKLLESLIHPLIRDNFFNYLAIMRKKSNRSIVVEIPLLFESKHPYRFDLIISAIAPYEIQQQRVLSRKGMTQEKFDAIIAKQVNNDFRKSNSDYLIFTDINKHHTYKQIKHLLVNERNKGNRT